MSDSDDDLSVWRREIERRLTTLEEMLKRTPPAVFHTAKPLSLGEFLRTKRPQTVLDKALAIAFHLEKNEGRSGFTLADIRRGFVTAKEPLPANSRDLVHRALKLGLMMETGAESEGFRSLVLTNSGERYVEAGFKRDVT